MPQVELLTFLTCPTIAIVGAKQFFDKHQVIQFPDQSFFSRELIALPGSHFNLELELLTFVLFLQ